MAPKRNKGEAPFAILTGDVVNSTKIASEGRDQLTSALEGIKEALESAAIQVASVSVFRGDSFQLVLQHPAQVCDAALFLRVWFRRVMIEGDGVLDIRLGLGLGPVEFQSKTQSLSDGTAFRYAADALEKAFTDKLSRIWFQSGDDLLNAHVNAVCVATEPYLVSLTTAQAQSLWWSMQGLTHTEIAQKLDVTQSTVTRALHSAQDKTIAYLRKYLYALVESYLAKNQSA